MPAVPGIAAVINGTLDGGETVTYDTAAPNPVADGLDRLDADDVTVDVLAGAILDTTDARAIRGGGDWTVNLAGTIRSRGYRGIQLNEEGEVFVTPTGVLEAFGGPGVDFTRGGRLDNRGSLHGHADYTAIFREGGRLDNGGTILNEGNRPLYFLSGGELHNESGGSITGQGNDTVYFLDGGSMTNRGSVAGGALATVNFIRGGRLDNFGDVSGDGSYTVRFRESGEFTNHGTVTGSGPYPVYFTDGGKLENHGTIAGAGLHAAYFREGGTLLNHGAITGAGDHPIYFRAGGQLVNHGSISGDGKTGIYFFDGGELVNHGSVFASGLYPVYFRNEGRVENHGVISGGSSRAVTFVGRGDVQNSGTIRAPSSVAVMFNAGGRLINEGGGTIESTSASGVVSNADLRVRNDPGAVITAGGGRGLNIAGQSELYNAGLIHTEGNEAVFLRAGGSVTNAGTLSGAGYALRFLGLPDPATGRTLEHDNVLTIEPGGSFVGLVDGGGGTDTLSLGGAEGADVFDLNAIGSERQFRDFEVFRKEGDATWTLTGAGAGDWTVAAGRLDVAGAVGGGVTATGGIVAGVGSLGSLDLRNARVAPGNSIGTLTVQGDVRLGDGSVYEVELDGNGEGDRIAAGGIATLEKGATLRASVIGNGPLVRHQQAWTVLTADGGFIDEGPAITDDFAGFGFTGRADGDAYRLTAVREPLAEAVRDPAARAAAAALDADQTGAGRELSAFVQAIGNQTAAEADRTLAATNPRAVASARAVQAATTRRFEAGLGDYLHGRRAGVPTGSGGGAFQLASIERVNPLIVAAALRAASGAPDERSPDEPYFDRGFSADDAGVAEPVWGGYASGYLVSDERDATATATGSRATTGAGQIGLDRRLGDRWLAGFSVHVADAEIDLNDDRGGDAGDVQVDSVRVGPYLGFAAGPWSADASLTAGFHRHEAERRNPGTGSAFESEHDSADVAASLGGGYAFDLAGWQLGPRAGLQYLHAWSDGYEESGGGGALAVDSTDAGSLRASLGLRVSRAFKLGGVRLLPRVEAGWARELLDTDEALTARFVGGSTPFTVAAQGEDADALYYGAGLAIVLTPTVLLDLGYAGEAASGRRTDAARLSLRVAF